MTQLVRVANIILPLNNIKSINPQAQLGDGIGFSVELFHGPTFNFGGSDAEEAWEKLNGFKPNDRYIRNDIFMLYGSGMDTPFKSFKDFNGTETVVAIRVGDDILSTSNILWADLSAPIGPNGLAGIEMQMYGDPDEVTIKVTGDAASDLYADLADAVSSSVSYKGAASNA